MLNDIEVPEIGENVESGIVVAVHIQTGDTISVDDTVIDLETDKALVEIPSPYAGRVAQVRARSGKQMKVGDVIARVESETADTQNQKIPPAADRAPGAAAAPVEDRRNATKEAIAQTTPKPSGTTEPAAREAKTTNRPPVPAAPSVRRLARELGVNISAVTGSGPGGRIGEADIQAHVRIRQATTPTEKTIEHHQVSATLPDFSQWGRIDIQPMDTVRRLTARSAAASWAVIPHVTQFDEADISGVTAFIETHRRKAEQAGAKLTITAVLAWICARALKRFPRFNASIDTATGTIIFKDFVHIGIATDTPRGLLVPVVRDADQRTLVDLARAIGDLARRSRTKKIKSDELEGGSFTISNQGGIGGVGFTPIVLWPQVAILGVSRSIIKPVYNGDRFDPAPILPLSLSYDHRIIDGADAVRFLRWICNGLEQPLSLFLK